MLELTFNELYSFLRCTTCGEKLEFDVKVEGNKPVKDAIMACAKCNSRYAIKDYVLRILPREFITVLKEIEMANNGTRYLRDKEIAEAYRWFAQQTEIPSEELGDHSLYWRDIDIALKICSKIGIDTKSTKEIVGMLSSHFMSSGYKKHVADQLSAPIQAIGYEKYEDIILRRVVNNLLTKESVVLIEFGSGVGRLLHQYGSCISNRSNACEHYRRYLSPMYAQNSITNGDALRLIIGIDFEQRMIQNASRWLRESKLHDLVQKGRIVQILASIRRLNLSFNSTPYENDTKIVCILFQTLGNQLSRDLVVDILKKAWQVASPNGLVFVSVFNKAVFDEQAGEYYSSIARSVGSAIYCKNGKFLSSKGVLSSWFAVNELEDIFNNAGIENFRIFDGNSLPVYEQYDKYINCEEQRFFKKRAIIGIGSHRAIDISQIL